jgi:hypothetical protein
MPAVLIADQALRDPRPRPVAGRRRADSDAEGQASGGRGALPRPHQRAVRVSRASVSSSAEPVGQLLRIRHQPLGGHEAGRHLAGVAEHRDAHADAARAGRPHQSCGDPAAWSASGRRLPASGRPCRARPRTYCATSARSPARRCWRARPASCCSGRSASCAGRPDAAAAATAHRLLARTGRDAGGHGGHLHVLQLRHRAGADRQRRERAPAKSAPAGVSAAGHESHHP